MPDDPNSIEPAIPPESEMLCELLERNGVAQWVVDKACILLEVAIDKYLNQPAPESEGPDQELLDFIDHHLAPSARFSEKRDKKLCQES